MITQKYVLTQKKFFVDLNGVFTDITQYVLTTPSVELEWGFSGDSPVSDLIAPTGTAKFTLNNISGKFTPNGASTFPGWRKGARAYIEFYFEDNSYRRFAGFIQDIIFQPARYGSNIGVVLADWFDIASRYPMNTIPISTDKRADEITIDIIGKTYVPPQLYDLDIGTNLFPLVYSSLTRKTRAYTELGKVAASEYAHIYLRKNKTHGEMLILENMLSRNGWSPLVQVQGDRFFILKAGSSTDYILKAGSATDRLLTSGGAVDVELDNIFLEGQLDIRHGANVMNVVEFTAYPSRVDTVDISLFALQEPISIGSGQTMVIRGNYFNAETGLQCNGMNMINPVANLDYKAWTNKAGSGTDFTTSLVITPVYNSDGFEHTVYNGSTSSGYITMFSVRGRGVYLENTITSRVEDEDSITLYGETSASLDQKYQRNLYLGEVIAKSIIAQNKDAEPDLKAIKFNANSSLILMRLMTVIDVGDLIHIKSTLGNIDGHYYINRVKITISPGEIYTVECLVDEKLSIMSGALSEISVDFRGEGFKDAINFGHLPYLADLPVRTMCAWVKFGAGPEANLDYVMGFFADGSAHEMVASNLAAGVALGFFQKYAPNGQQWWFAPYNMTRGTWYHVATVKDLSSDTPPKLYVNGNQATATLGTTPEVGKTAFSDLGVPFILGNIKTATIDYAWGYTGSMQDARVYNRELSAVELLQIYNSANPDPSIIVDQSALLFQALAVKTSNLADYINQPLTGLSVFDNIFRAVGVANDTPTGRNPV